MLSLFFFLLAHQLPCWAVSAAGWSSDSALDDSAPEDNALTYTDICGTWSEKGSCISVACHEKKFQVATYQFTAPGSSSSSSPSFNWTTQEYPDRSCGEGQGGLQVGVFGTYTLTGIDGKTGWTKLTYYPSKLSVYIPPVTDSSSSSATSPAPTLFSWPDGTCAYPVEYLNSFCPCGGTWAEGMARTLTLASCPEGSCPAFQGVKWYTSLKKGSPLAFEESNNREEFDAKEYMKNQKMEPSPSPSPRPTYEWLGFTGLTQGTSSIWQGYDHQWLHEAVARDGFDGCQTLGSSSGKRFLPYWLW